MAELAMLAKLQPLPDARRLSIYRLRTPKITIRSAKALVSRLGLEEGTVERFETDEVVGIRQGPWELSLARASASLRLRHKLRWQIDDGESNVDYSDREAETIARRFVERRKLAKSSEMRLLKVARLHVAVATLTREEHKERAIDAGVAFQRLVDGVPVDGPGGKLIVYLDAKREVLGFDRTWRELDRPQRRVDELRRVEDALHDVEVRWRGREGTVAIDQVRFGYFEHGPRVEQRILQPAYVFLMTLSSRDSRIHRRTVYVAPAATNHIGQITPALRPKVRQPVRQTSRSRAD